MNVNGFEFIDTNNPFLNCDAFFREELKEASKKREEKAQVMVDPFTGLVTKFVDI